MSALIFLVILVVIVCIALILVMVASKMTNPGRKSRREKELERLVYRLRELAYHSRDVEPNLSFLITDEIEKFNTKEIG